MANDHQQQLIIPDRIKVGYKKRDDTYTKRLAYIIYYDHKGVLRKKKSLESWRHTDIPLDDFKNEPTEGFVLNKGVGGKHDSHGCYIRNEYIRVYDPRNFEVEISVANLLFILSECDCSRGKGLEGKFVYAWDGTSLVLLPVRSLDYQNSLRCTKLHIKKIGVRDLVPGITYVTKKQQEYTYLGKFDYYYLVKRGKETTPPSKLDTKGVEKRYVFWDGKTIVPRKNVKNIFVQKSDEQHPDFAALVDQYNKSPHGSPVVRLFLKEVPNKPKKHYRDDDEHWFFEDKDGSFVDCYTTYSKWRSDQNEAVMIQSDCCYSIESGLFIKRYDYREAYSPALDGHYKLVTTTMEWREPTTMRLFAETARGVEYQVTFSGYFRCTQFDK